MHARCNDFGWRVAQGAPATGSIRTVADVAHPRRLDGAFDDDTERTAVTIMARTVPGIAAVRLQYRAR